MFSSLPILPDTAENASLACLNLERAKEFLEKYWKRAGIGQLKGFRVLPVISLLAAYNRFLLHT
jgi:hypothetical protein